MEGNQAPYNGEKTFSPLFSSLQIPKGLLPRPRAFCLAPLMPQREEVVHVFLLRVALFGVAEQLVEAERAHALRLGQAQQLGSGLRRLPLAVFIDVLTGNSSHPSRLFRRHFPDVSRGQSLDDLLNDAREAVYLRLGLRLRLGQCGDGRRQRLVELAL
jgi:hypothetical protein